MTNNIVDGRGLPCPQPVIATKKAMQNLGPNTPIISIVDNEIAVENVKRFASKEGYRVEVETKEGLFYLTLTPGISLQSQPQTLPPLQPVVIPNSPLVNKVILLKSDKMGLGDDALGNLLMKSLFYTLTQSQELMPEKIIFINSAVHLLKKESPLLDDIIKLREAKVEIIACGTCLDFYGLKEELAVGRVSNMYEIYEILAQHNCLTVS